MPFEHFEPSLSCLSISRNAHVALAPKHFPPVPGEVGGVGEEGGLGAEG